MMKLTHDTFKIKNSKDNSLGMLIGNKVSMLDDDVSQNILAELMLDNTDNFLIFKVDGKYIAVRVEGDTDKEVHTINLKSGDAFRVTEVEVVVNNTIYSEDEIDEKAVIMLKDNDDVVRYIILDNSFSNSYGDSQKLSVRAQEVSYKNPKYESSDLNLSALRRFDYNLYAELGHDIADIAITLAMISEFEFVPNKADTVFLRGADRMGAIAFYNTMGYELNIIVEGMRLNSYTGKYHVKRSFDHVNDDICYEKVEIVLYGEGDKSIKITAYSEVPDDLDDPTIRLDCMFTRSEILYNYYDKIKALKG